MRTRLLCCLLVLLSCAKRINPDPGGSRTTWSGVPVRFGQPQEIPEGTQILWDFGDGAPPQQGVSVVHAYPRAGVYTVVETVRVLPSDDITILPLTVSFPSFLPDNSSVWSSTFL